MNNIIKFIKKNDIGKLLVNADLKKFTTYKVGGIASVIVYPEDVHKLIKLLKFIKEENVKYKILGNGSNVIFSSKKYEGVIIKLDELNDLEIKGNKVRVGAGYNLMKLSLKTSMLGLSGLEFATGIPGSVGGAVYMNAGAYNSSISDVLESVNVLTPDLEIKELKNEDLDFSYRTSMFQKKDNYICLNVKFKLSFLYLLQLHFQD